MLWKINYQQFLKIQADTLLHLTFIDKVAVKVCSLNIKGPHQGCVCEVSPKFSGHLFLTTPLWAYIWISKRKRPKENFAYWKRHRFVWKSLQTCREQFFKQIEWKIQKICLQPLCHHIAGFGLAILEFKLFWLL